MKYNVLVVEDQREISNIVTKYLEKENFSYKIAETGIKALDIFAKDTFHLILLDVMMPGMDGFELCKTIKSDVNISHMQTTIWIIFQFLLL